MPSFILVDHEERPLRSTELAGQWYLLYWYPKADTPGCTVQAEGLRDQHAVFQELGCVVLGASFDEPEANRLFQQKYRLPFRLLSDVDRSVAQALDVCLGGDLSYAPRIAYLVNPAGLIMMSYLVDDPEFFAERVLDDLEGALDAG